MKATKPQPRAGAGVAFGKGNTPPKRTATTKATPPEHKGNNEGNTPEGNTRHAHEGNTPPSLDAPPHPLLDHLASTLWGRSRTAALAAGNCVRCGRLPVLANQLDMREYHVSALCPECWLDIFGEDQP